MEIRIVSIHSNANQRCPIGGKRRRGAHVCNIVRASRSTVSFTQGALLFGDGDHQTKQKKRILTVMCVVNG
ncbi:hypothetical protein PISMIDRAFT_356953 [Pisolithus microcarpus 441]|uniref:Uncharacterized protein n=1 Tax=Pisolithus microcarpus 441 TaxID=765257 RepID=A0A0C9ZGW5_9AGAM|nr:hypothetical protein PISMIDRAFT_356953 [Pisolithus microcarpus 441]